MTLQPSYSSVLPLQSGENKREQTTHLNGDTLADAHLTVPSRSVHTFFQEHRSSLTNCLHRELDRLTRIAVPTLLHQCKKRRIGLWTSFSKKNPLSAAGPSMNNTTLPFDLPRSACGIYIYILKTSQIKLFSSRCLHCRYPSPPRHYSPCVRR